MTVSYGTFSCTAEGFDDPLAVVKETTHFFRGVVGEDRFFGAEPPQFDPELASEMMRNQLSAEMGQGKLSIGNAVGAASSGALAAALSAGPARAAAPVAPATQDAPQPVYEDSLPDDDTIEATAVLTERPLPGSDPEDLTEEPQDDAPAQPVLETPDIDLGDFMAAQSMPDLSDEASEPEIDIVEPAARLTPSSDVAAKLDRIRAVVAEAPEAYDDTSEAETAYDASYDDEDDGEEVDDDALTALLGEFNADDDEEELSDVALAEAAEELSDDDAEDNLFADTLAGLMQNQDFDDEDAALDTAPTAAGDAFSAWDDDAEDEFLDTAEDPADDTPKAAELDETDAFDDFEDEDDALPEAQAAPEPAPTPAPAPKQPIRARVVKVKRAVFEEAVKSGQFEEVDETPAAPQSEESSLSPEEEDDLARELAAVKAELNGDWDDDDEDDDFLDDAPAPAAKTDDWGWDDEDDAEDLAPAAAAPAPVSDWDDDDEDEDDMAAPAPLRLDNPVSTPKRPWDTDLDALDARASAALGDDEDDIDALVRDSARKAVKMASPARAMLTENTVEDDDASRILNETNKELDEPEGNRRRTAIAHLRAAVAATKADRLLGRKADKEEEIEPYREDLANVVRPRRPQSGAPRTERPAEVPARPAPLKLVAEQRVPSDEAPQQQVTPVRPRRIQRSAATTPREVPAPQAPEMDGGFADYAASVGAVDLPELLEAAAAYMSYVEGREQFSRPQLMTTVRQAEQQESSREDRLRSFGQLLREGKIEKTSGGRFTASDRISFKPDRAAG
ncbi:hypothetical protein [Tropicibacter naphthalenivorans]|uniref:hypothetical protein n=1 Tax=Tropicibacter naphthalenivorans TaxID=441103 RepID=UPI00071E17DA|nr:hypothetical protein [Tropicibacter naphthalenivorans]